MKCREVKRKQRNAPEGSKKETTKIKYDVLKLLGQMVTKS